ncbi:YadA-like family protein [uncultured Fusobacterium sp.]|uniref:YadA-like family protein n=1 Tax=uncultured Fusobacterium sp. TaxID=159267 RepID=UPI0028055AF1|nr:YadA-like family protein [uncultured Fusobacterium sp.]
MNKKFMVVALMAALSTVGYAENATVDYVNDRVDNAYNTLKKETENDYVKKQDFDKAKDKVGKLDMEIGDLTGKLASVNDDKTRLEKELNDKIDKNKTELNDKIDENTNKLQQQITANEHKREDTDRLLTERIDNETTAREDADAALDKKIEDNKLAQEKRDEEQDGKINNVSQRVDGLRDEMNTANVQQNQKIEDNTIAIDKLDEENKTQNGRLDAVEKENNKQNERLDIVEENAEAGLILAQKNENSISDLYANKVDNSKFEEHKKDQAEKDKQQDQALKDETTAREEADKELGGRIDTLQQDFAKYDGRLSGLEKKVDNLDNKMNKGLSLMAAMNAVDFQNVQTGEMAIGAGVGHYGNAQSVALGVAYSPVQDLTVNAKYSVTAGDVDSFALGAGATYKFKVGR